MNQDIETCSIQPSNCFSQLVLSISDFGLAARVWLQNMARGKNAGGGNTLKMCLSP